MTGEGLGDGYCFPQMGSLLEDTGVFADGLSLNAGDLVDPNSHSFCMLFCLGQGSSCSQKISKKVGVLV